MNIIIKEILEELIEKEFFISQSDIESNPSYNAISKYINKQILINSDTHLNYMKVFYQNSSNLCGYHCLFYSMCYIKYITSNHNCYYLWKMNSCKRFWAFYRKAAHFLFNAYKGDEYLLKELSNEGSLEREQLNLFIESRSDIFPLANGHNIIFHYKTIDYICGQFSMEEDKIIKLQKVIEEIKSIKKNTPLCSKRNVYLFFIGITNHWLLFVLDCATSGAISYYVFDSCDTSTELFVLTTQQEKDDYIEKMNIKEQTLYKKKPLTNYQKQSFLDWINDMNGFFAIFLKIINNDSNQVEFTLPYRVLSKTIDQVISSYESSLRISFKEYENEIGLSIFSKDKDMTEVLLQIYMWLLSEHPPLALESLIIPKLISFQIKSKPLFHRLLKFTHLNILLIDKYHSYIDLDDSEELFAKFKNCLIKIRGLIQSL